MARLDRNTDSGCSRPNRLHGAQEGAAEHASRGARGEDVYERLSLTLSRVRERSLVLVWTSGRWRNRSSVADQQQAWHGCTLVAASARPAVSAAGAGPNSERHSVGRSLQKLTGRRETEPLVDRHGVTSGVNSHPTRPEAQRVLRGGLYER